MIEHHHAISLFLSYDEAGLFVVIVITLQKCYLLLLARAPNNADCFDLSFRIGCIPNGDVEVLGMIKCFIVTLIFLMRLLPILQ
jgi:hypothetical protein